MEGRQRRSFMDDYKRQKVATIGEVPPVRLARQK
jgi:hypothetical protein